MQLETVPLFANLTPKELQDLHAMVEVRTYPADSIVIRQGEAAGGAMFIIQSGHVKVLLTNDDGDDIPITAFGPGEYFGEMSLMDDKPRSATVVTTEASELVMLTREGFNAVLERHPGIAKSLFMEFAKRLRECDQMVKTFVRSDTLGRVTRFLAVFAQADNNHNLLSPDWTPARIAELVDTNPDNVNRILDSFAQQGFISRTADGIRVHRHHLIPDELLMIW